MNVNPVGCGPRDLKVVVIVNAPISRLYPNLGCLEMFPYLRNPALMGLKE